MRTQRYLQVYREAIAISILVGLAIVGGTSWWTWHQTKPISTKSIPTVIASEQGDKFNPKPTSQVTHLEPHTYWLRVDNGQIHLTPQPVAIKEGVTSEIALREALNNLLTEPKTSELSTTIPPGTKLLSLRVTKAGIYIDLSREFSQGGGTTSMSYRVAQVIYTATSIDPTAKVFLSIAGEPVDIDHPLGGEGLILRQPITRREFVEDFSIF
ncbi:GerMN domain-containing protein [Nostocaceae cyanobacterium CENA357]|uniref:GerMN domain-containing protein n=1 Tax=Atlanticothrix silvestris CENA357 TaxID=1725252 RepID=A0A8J7HKN6_9CYAN|nr:GerMN domain-containing protein [Atlanticothrix silvestris]MBH8554385.1 GerMN domain-containing protein [Atlanticothrix silvestris CENA357]